MSERERQREWVLMFNAISLFLPFYFSFEWKNKTSRMKKNILSFCLLLYFFNRSFIRSSRCYREPGTVRYRERTCSAYRLIRLVYPLELHSPRLLSSCQSILYFWIFNFFFFDLSRERKYLPIFPRNKSQIKYFIEGNC